MEKRPKIKLKLSPTDKIAEYMGWIMLSAVWILTLAYYKSLPDIIPVHYNAAGEADRHGEKWMIFTLPLIATLLYIGMTLLNKHPHIFNYPIPITKENAEKQYTFATRMTRYLKLVIVVIFGLIAFTTIRHAYDQEAKPGVWFLPVLLGMLATPIIYWLIRSLQSK